MLKIYNTLSKKKQLFKPMHGNRVGMYTCGPTVYDHAHIGNLRSYIFADSLFRVLSDIEGYKVKWVVNITDIDDKIIKKIKNKKGDPIINLNQITGKYFALFLKDIEKIGINIKNIDFVFATKNIKKMQSVIKNLLDKENAYITNGSIYFSIKNYQSSGNNYGVLANIPSAGKIRITDDQDQKEGIADFALWKAKKNNEPCWDFKYDNHNFIGRPGWHIECSAMSIDKLGQPFDIHTGGVDLIFPHHENEIAQSGGKLAQYFVHNEHLLVNGHKMSKSLNNFYTLSKISDPLAFRYLCFATHYQSKMDFSLNALDSARQRLTHLRQYCSKLLYNHHKTSGSNIKKTKTLFIKAVEDNLNFPLALSILSSLQSDNDFSTEKLNLFKLADNIMNLSLIKKFKAFDKTEKKIQKQRHEARCNGDFKKSDALRNKLMIMGIESEDLQNESIYWRR